MRGVLCMRVCVLMTIGVCMAMDKKKGGGASALQTLRIADRTGSKWTDH